MLFRSSQIAASEVVAAKCTASATNTITASDVRINFSVVSFDTHGVVTTGASWVFTAPVSGIYSINGMLQASGATYSSGQRVTIYAWVAGVQQELAGIWRAQTAYSTSIESTFAGTFRMNAGEGLYITAASNHGSGTLTTSGAGNWITITRQGGVM